MPPTAEPPPKLKPPRTRFRRVLRWLGVLLLVALIFHRPLFHAVARIALRMVAARMHLALDLHTSGTIFTNLSVHGIKARANGTGPTPVRSIDIELVRLDYSLPLLIRRGVGEFLHSYEIHQATLDIEALPSATKDERKEKVAIAEQLNDILGQPAAYSDRVVIQNFNITVRAPASLTEVQGFNLLLDPERPGFLRVARLAIPGTPVWENLDAETSYEARNFFIRNLRLAPELMLEEVNFDASQRAQNKGSMDLKARAFGGTVHFSLAGSQLKKPGKNLENSYDTKLTIDIADIALDRAAAYFKAPAPPVKTLRQFSILFTGEPEKPRTWRGNLQAGTGGISAGAVTLDGATLQAVFQDGHADIVTAEVAIGHNRVGLNAKIGLPESVNDFDRSDVDAVLRIAAPDLPALAPTLPDPVSGEVRGGGAITLRGGVLEANVNLQADAVSTKDVEVQAGKIGLRVRKQVNPAPASTFEGLEGQVTADFSALRFQTFKIDSVRLETEVHNDFVKLQRLEIQRGESTITASGNARLPKEGQSFDQLPVEGQFAIHVPSLGSFGIAAQGQTLTGHFEGEGTLKKTGGALAGAINLGGGEFALGKFKADRLAVKIDVADNVAVIDQLAVILNGSSQLVVTGKTGLAKPFAYEAGLLIDFKNLATFQPLLDLFAVKQKLAGALAVQWSGKGQVDPQQHSGELDFALTKAKFGAIDLSEVHLAGTYTPEYAETKAFHVVSGPTSLGGAIEFRENRLRLKDLNLQQAGISVLTGYVFLPFDPSNHEQPISFDERIAATINTNKLELEKLLTSFAIPAPASGAFTANLVAGGTLRAPFAHLRVNGERLQAKAAKQFAPASLALDLHYSNKEATLAAKVSQPQIQPLIIKGRAPLDLDATLQKKQLDPALPLDLEIQLPPSSLAVVPKFVPAVRRIDGTVALNVHVGGTVQKPALSGGLNVDLKGARMLNENIPGVGAFHARLAFAENKLNFQTFEGEVGGGKFKLGGAINLADLKDPVFALHLDSHEILVKRDDSITVRADADVKVDGPLKAATVSGAVYVVRSRFFKEIDILPIALPGKPKPAPKVAQTGPTVISFPQAPLRDWKFDLALKTRENDPFLIRGNLANGAVSLALKLGGTGLAPYLEGTAKIEQFTATLPFSNLSLTSGFISFSKDSPFQPSLELQAESHIRDYLVHAFIYGKATDPQVQLNSEPPLPYADIISLLATGTTTSELAGNADALASRAALIAIKELYQKTFHRGAAPAVEEKKKPTGSPLDRFEFELGALSNRNTSGQDMKARFKVNDQIYLMGDVGVDGSFTGSLKYLIRFR